MKTERRKYGIWGVVSKVGRGLRGEAAADRGMALVLVLILSAIALATMAGLIYMLTVRTQSSGAQKRYRNTVEAGHAGTDISFHVIAERGVLSMSGIGLTFPSNGTCLTQKLDKPTFNADGSLNWSGCDDSSYIDPGDSATYDWSFQVGDAGGGQGYNVYSKIVNTVNGNSAGSKGLIKGNGVASTDSGEITVMHRPYMYTLEVDAERGGTRPEKSRYSILYEY